MTHISANSVNDVQIALCQHLLEVGSEVDPRGMKTRELLGVTFVLENPRQRLTTIEARRWSSSLAIAELAWHLRGDDDVAALAFYTPRWRDFADENGTVRGSCYGARIFSTESTGTSQWNNVRRLLTEDRCSRRAVLNFRVAEDVSRASSDVSCTNTIQFVLRGGCLHAFTNMRSNDAIWGVPYDVFLFTCLQELMAIELGVDVGQYHHYAASMHVYERHYRMAEKIAETSALAESVAMPPMASAGSVRQLAIEEQSLRLRGTRSRGRLDEFSELCIDLLGRHKNISWAA